MKALFPALIFLFTFLLTGCSQDRSAELRNLHATVFNQSRPLADFSLRDHNEKPFSLENLKGKWSILFFGYTNCPDVCPNTLTIMNVVSKQLPADKVQYVFVSVDPYRDKLDTLAKYVPYFNPNFIGVTETQAGEVGKLTKQLGILSMPVANNSAAGKDNYLVEHSANLILINPQGNWHGVMSTPHEPAKIVKEFNLIREIHNES